MGKIEGEICFYGVWCTGDTTVLNITRCVFKNIYIPVIKASVEKSCAMMYALYHDLLDCGLCGTKPPRIMKHRQLNNPNKET